MQRDGLISKQQPEEYVEGGLYRFVDGEFKLIEQDEPDGRINVKLSKVATDALKQARSALTKALGWRPEMASVACAIIEVHSAEATVPETMQIYLDRVVERHRVTGR